MGPLQSWPTISTPQSKENEPSIDLSDIQLHSTKQRIRLFSIPRTSQQELPISKARGGGGGDLYATASKLFKILCCDPIDEPCNAYCCHGGHVEHSQVRIGLRILYVIPCLLPSAFNLRSPTSTLEPLAGLQLQGPSPLHLRRRPGNSYSTLFGYKYLDTTCSEAVNQTFFYLSKRFYQLPIPYL